MQVRKKPKKYAPNEQPTQHHRTESNHSENEVQPDKIVKKQHSRKNAERTTVRFGATAAVTPQKK